MEFKDAMELMWEEYWEKLKAHPEYSEISELIKMGLKPILKASYESGFLTSRKLSIANEKSDRRLMV